MALTIGPAVRKADQRTLLAVHGLGLWLGATVMAFILTLIGGPLASLLEPIRPIPEVTVGVVLVLWASRMILGVGLPYMSSRWQVPVYWRETLPPIVTLGAFGLLLGIGALTSVVFPVFWILVGGTLISGSLSLNVAAWWLYAALRFATTAHATIRRFDPSADLATIGEVAPSHWRLVRGLAAAVLLLTGIWLISAV